MGLLCARQYFRGETLLEQRVCERITALWEEVEWNWYTQGGRTVLSWHWSPNNGWALDHEIRGWNECLITYVLAAALRRATPSIRWSIILASRKGATFSTVNLTTVLSCRWEWHYGGPLFFTHYSFCALDPPRFDGPLCGLLAAEPAPCAHQLCALRR